MKVSMKRPIDKSSNHLLAALPDAEWGRWNPHLETIDLKLGQVLYESGEKMSYAYFPIDSIISLLFVLENGPLQKLPLSATKVSWGFHCSWVEKQRRVVQLFKVQDYVYDSMPKNW